MGNQGWFDNSIAVDPFDHTVVFVGGVSLDRFKVSDGDSTWRGPVEFDQGGTDSWLGLTPPEWGIPGNLITYLDPAARDTTAADYASIELRFGQGSQ